MLPVDLHDVFQFTEEKLGQAEKTELDPHLENLLAKADSTKNWTEKILRQTEVLLQPNPSARIEEYIYDKLDRKLPSRTTNAELLGQFMLDAAKEFGADTPYGTTLITVGEYQRKLGGAEREFLHTAAVTFLSPLRNFLEGDWRTISKERRLLENRRLDLDICKARLKKAKQAEAKAASPPQAELELRVAQTEFDRQAEVTRLLLEGISSTHLNHLRCLQDFAEAQATYFAQCHHYMQDLQRELNRSDGFEVDLGSKWLNVWDPVGSLTFFKEPLWVPVYPSVSCIRPTEAIKTNPLCNQWSVPYGAHFSVILYVNARGIMMRFGFISEV
uniref:BAR domain-containing protein n=1 Tax=Xiphophorus couchianus TaxID=32473 RepID=A0A3B5KTQ6_9TELE